jgi:hypothetical protein
VRPDGRQSRRVRLLRAERVLDALDEAFAAVVV